jgi:predicted nucleotidyltransferase
MEQIMQKETIINYLMQHKQEFQKKYGIEKIGLFGSYARDEAHYDSDIDIFVQMKPDMFKLVELKQQIEEDLQKKVDIIRNHKYIKPLLLKMIQKDIHYV